MEFSIQHIAATAGVSSRTLRHYDAIGLLTAQRSRNGYRAYSDKDLVRLQRILLLRDLGMGLPEIAAVLDGGIDDVTALREHAGQLRERAQVLQRQLASVERTIAALMNKEEIMPEEMFDGFDHAQYREEVEQRWGARAWQASDRWWRGTDDAGRKGFLAEAAAIGAAWQQAQADGVPAADPRAQELAARHVRWIEQGWGGTRPAAEQIVGLAEMYVADERFAANYGGPAGAAYVRDALIVFARSE